MRTFHIGGAATKVSEENKTYLKYPFFIKTITGSHVEMTNGAKLFTRKGFILGHKILSSIEIKKGDKLLVKDEQRVIKGEPLMKREGEVVPSTEIAYVRKVGDRLLLVAQEQKLDIRNGAEVVVKEGQVMKSGETIASFDPFSEPIIAEADGWVHYEDIIPGTTLKEEVNEDTGNIEKRIAEFGIETKQPRLIVSDESGNELVTYYIPGGAYLNVDDNEAVKAGKILAKQLKESAKTKDITGGLPRVGELFEARKPKVQSVLAQITGAVQFKGIVKGKRVIIIRDAFTKEFKHLVPMGRRLLVRDGDTVEAGEQLCDGNVVPQDVLHILGENALQSYLMNEVQAVYRLQGVNINDKHIGIIIRQMMRKVEIVYVGDTRFIYGQQIDKFKFNEENARVIAEGGQPAVGRPVLLGITRASLNIDSFISAASFQETTRVLTNASIAGSVDPLHGLKENVLIGHLIPAGTGLKTYRSVKLYDQNHEDLDAYMEKVLERKRIEKEQAPVHIDLDEEEISDQVEDEPVDELVTPEE